jgi:hypothetical protein
VGGAFECLLAVENLISLNSAKLTGGNFFIPSRGLTKTCKDKKKEPRKGRRPNTFT